MRNQKTSSQVRQFNQSRVSCALEPTSSSKRSSSNMRSSNSKVESSTGTLSQPGTDGAAEMMNKPTYHQPHTIEAKEMQVDFMPHASTQEAYPHNQSQKKRTRVGKTPAEKIVWTKEEVSFGFASHLNLNH